MYCIVHHRHVRSRGPVHVSRAWVQWHAFDVIVSMTFHRRFGFLEQRNDNSSMIGNLDGVLHYVNVIEQLPELHGLLLGNEKLVRFLKKWFPQISDPLYRSRR
jgi:hypothetical protein